MNFSGLLTAVLLFQLHSAHPSSLRISDAYPDKARYAPSEQQVLEELSNDARPGDLIITIGAGSVWKIGEALAKRLKDPDTGLGTRDMGHGTQG